MGYGTGGGVKSINLTRLIERLIIQIERTPEGQAQEVMREAVAVMASGLRYEKFGEAADMLEALAAERDGYRKLALAGELTARHVDILTTERDTLRVQLDATLKDRAMIIAERDAMSARVDALEADNDDLRINMDADLITMCREGAALKAAEAENERLRKAHDRYHALLQWLQEFATLKRSTRDAIRAALQGDKP
jgi:hypothetical protein